MEVSTGDEPGRVNGGSAQAVEQPLGSADWVGMSDQAGELVLSGPQVAETPLYTGDLARIDEDGYLWIVGRLKDVIIRGGHNIDPKMVEDVCYQHPQVLDAVVVGQPDAYAGEIPVVYVQPKEGAALDAQELMDFVAEHALERAAIPKYCRVVPAIPQSSVGKMLRPEVQLWAIRDGVLACVQSALQSQPSQQSQAEFTVQVERRPDGSVDIELQHGPEVCREDLEQAVAQLALAVTIRARA